MKKQFEVGMRVAVYGALPNIEQPMIGVIEEVCLSGMLRVRQHKHGIGVLYHPKQLRRLIRKPRRRWTPVNETCYASHPGNRTRVSIKGPDIGPGEQVEVIEVRKGKK